MKLILSSRQHRRDQGFTLVELSMAISFIGVLLVMIALLIMQVSSIYNRGITLRSINESGQLLSSELQRKITTATSVKVAESNIEGVSTTGGRLCVDDTVYAWNYPNAVKGDLNTYPDGGVDVKFVKFIGSDVFCTRQSADPVNPESLGSFPALPDRKEVRDLLGDASTNIVVRSLNYDGAPLVIDSAQTMHHVSLVLGTDTIDLLDDTGECMPPSEAGSDFCAVNQFSFIARSAANGGGIE